MYIDNMIAFLKFLYFTDSIGVFDLSLESLENYRKILSWLVTIWSIIYFMTFLNMNSFFNEKQSVKIMMIKIIGWILSSIPTILAVTTLMNLPSGFIGYVFAIISFIYLFSLFILAASGFETSNGLFNVNGIFINYAKELIIYDCLIEEAKLEYKETLNQKI